MEVYKLLDTKWHGNPILIRANYRSALDFALHVARECGLDFVGAASVEWFGDWQSIHYVLVEDVALVASQTQIEQWNNGCNDMIPARGDQLGFPEDSYCPPGDLYLVRLK